MTTSMTAANNAATDKSPSTPNDASKSNGKAHVTTPAATSNIDASLLTPRDASEATTDDNMGENLAIEAKDKKPAFIVVGENIGIPATAAVPVPSHEADCQIELISELETNIKQVKASMEELRRETAMQKALAAEQKKEIAALKNKVEQGNKLIALKDEEIAAVKNKVEQGKKLVALKDEKIAGLAAIIRAIRALELRDAAVLSALGAATRTTRISVKGILRTLFSIGDLAEFYAPTLANPRKSAGQHARKYARDEVGRWVEGVWQDSSRTTYMTLEVFERCVWTHFRHKRAMPQ